MSFPQHSGKDKQSCSCMKPRTADNGIQLCHALCVFMYFILKDVGIAITTNEECQHKKRQAIRGLAFHKGCYLSCQTVNLRSSYSENRQFQRCFTNRQTMLKAKIKKQILHKEIVLKVCVVSAAQLLPH